jgi:hypothetical protein
VEGTRQNTGQQRKTPMPDLLTHVLLAAALTLLARRRWKWATEPYAVVAMAGALIPDVNHVAGLVSPAAVETTLGVSVGWGALQTGGGVALLVGLAALTVTPTERRRVLTLLALGAGSHLLADMGIRVASGRSQSVLWPLTRYQPPSPGLYTSAELWPLGGAAALAVGAWLLVRSDE